MKADYKNFSELAYYARLRMKKSISRNDPMAALYWFNVERWAADHPDDFHSLIRLYQSLRVSVEREEKAGLYKDCANHYWKLKHLRIMLVNNGRKIPRLGLNWLRAWGETMEKRET